MPFASIPELLDALRRGRMVVLVDDPDRENEGDVVIAADRITPEAIAFMEREARGLICVALSPERCDRLDLPPQVAGGNALHGTAFTVSVDAARGATTGISAADRALCIRLLADPASTPADFARPGHVFPIRARAGGVLVRAGQTEGSVDLARLAGLTPAAVICEIKNPDGSMARLPDLEHFAATHGILLGCIADLIEHRRRQETLVQRVGVARLPTAWGDFDLYLYRSTIDETLNCALVRGMPKAAAELPEARREDAPVLVRVHSRCLTGDVFASTRCDCGEQLAAAQAQIAEAGRGVLLYMLMQEGRGIGLEQKVLAYALQDRHGLDTVEANHRLGLGSDLRHYGVGAQILRDLGVRRMRLLTNNPKKVVGLEGYGLEIVERVPIVMPPHAANRDYLRAKRDKLGHLLPGALLDAPIEPS